MEILKRLLRGFIDNYRTTYEALDRFRDSESGRKSEIDNVSPPGAMLVWLGRRKGRDEVGVLLH